MAVIFECRIEGGGVGRICDDERYPTQAQRDAAMQKAWQIAYEIAAKAEANPDRPNTMEKLYGKYKPCKVTCKGITQSGKRVGM